MTTDLSLAEQILLLHMDETSGRLTGGYTPLLVVAAEIGELALENRVTVTDREVIVRDSQETDDPGRNLMLTRLVRTKQQVGIVTASPDGADRERIQRAVSGRLVGRGIWASEEQRTFFSRHTIYATIEPAVAEKVKADLQRTLESQQPVHPRQAVLLGLLKGARRLETALSRQESRFFEERIRQIIADSPIASGLCRQIEMVISDDAAVVVASVTAVIISS